MMTRSKGALWLTLTCGAAVLTAGPVAAQTVHPTKISSAEAKGPIFSSPKAEKMGTPDNAVNVTMLGSSDKKVVAGIYQAGPSTLDMSSYPVDEFMYFLEGSATLISEDGTVTHASAGDAITVPKGWKGKWETKGYRKYYVIYNPEGMGPPENK